MGPTPLDVSRELEEIIDHYLLNAKPCISHHLSYIVEQVNEADTEEVVRHVHERWTVSTRELGLGYCNYCILTSSVVCLCL